MTDVPEGEAPRSPDAADLARLVGDTRAADAVRARARERTLRQQATAEATVVGVLIDVAEQGVDVSVRTRAGRLVHGRVAGLGRDFVALRPAQGPDTWVVLSAISVVRRRPGERPLDSTGDRVGPTTAGLNVVLAELAPERPRVALAVDGEATLVIGELRAVGVDIATIRMDGDPPATAYVPLASVSVATVLLAGG